MGTNRQYYAQNANQIAAAVLRCFPGDKKKKKRKERRTESRNLLAVLDQLDLDALADSRVGLLGLNTDLLEDDALGVRGTTEGRRLVGGSEKALLVLQVGPAVVAARGGQLSGGVQATGLSFTHLGGLCGFNCGC